jgi:hypothetical protein
LLEHSIKTPRIPLEPLLDEELETALPLCRITPLHSNNEPEGEADLCRIATLGRIKVLKGLKKPVLPLLEPTDTH